MELSRNITVIPARKRVGNTAAAEQRPKLKVAAYCRVSTDSEEQASSYEVQVAHYTQFIQKNPESEPVPWQHDLPLSVDGGGRIRDDPRILCEWRFGRGIERSARRGGR